MKPMSDSFSNILMDLYPVEDTSHDMAKFAAALEQMPLDVVKELVKSFGKKAAVGTIYPSKDEPATSSSEGRIHDFLKQDKIDPLFGKVKKAAQPSEAQLKEWKQKGEDIGERGKGLAKHVGIGAAIGAGAGGLGQLGYDVGKGILEAHKGLKAMGPEALKELGELGTRRGLLKETLKAFPTALRIPETRNALLKRLGRGAAIGAPIAAAGGAGLYALRNMKKMSPEEKEQLKQRAVAAQKNAACSSPAPDKTKLKYMAIAARNRRAAEAAQKTGAVSSEDVAHKPLSWLNRPGGRKDKLLNYMYAERPKLREEAEKKDKRLGVGAGIGALSLGIPGAVGAISRGAGVMGSLASGMGGAAVGAIPGLLGGGLYHRYKRRKAEAEEVEKMKAEKVMNELARHKKAASIMDMATDIAAASPAEMAGAIKKVAGAMLAECWKTAAIVMQRQQDEPGIGGSVAKGVGIGAGLGVAGGLAYPYAKAVSGLRAAGVPWKSVPGALVEGTKLTGAVTRDLWKSGIPGVRRGLLTGAAKHLGVPALIGAAGMGTLLGARALAKRRARSEEGSSPRTIGVLGY